MFEAGTRMEDGEVEEVEEDEEMETNAARD